MLRTPRTPTYLLPCRSPARVMDFQVITQDELILLLYHGIDDSPDNSN